jgi:hypothetical protein
MTTKSTSVPSAQEIARQCVETLQAGDSYGSEYEIILSAITAAVAQAKEEDKQLREALVALEDYVDHAPICCANESTGRGCDCGLEEARTKANQALELKEPAAVLVDSPRQKLISFDYAPWTPPFTYSKTGTEIRDSQNRKCIDILGWGFLIGTGDACAMKEETAGGIQDTFGEHVANLLNITSVPDVYAGMVAFIPKIDSVAPQAEENGRVRL